VIVRYNECYSKTKKKQILGMSPGLKPEKSHFTPEVKVANEIVHDHV
jgi:hypothetical protein